MVGNPCPSRATATGAETPGTTIFPSSCGRAECVMEYTPARPTIPRSKTKARKNKAKRARRGRETDGEMKVGVVTMRNSDSRFTLVRNTNCDGVQPENCHPSNTLE